LTVALDVVTDRSISGHTGICIHDSPSDSGAASDVTVVENDRVLYQSTAVDAHPATQYRVDDHSSGERTQPPEITEPTAFPERPSSSYANKVLDEIDVLKNGVGGAPVPGLFGRAHLCRYRDDELIAQ
jgi:hypothetical protein